MKVKDFIDHVPVCLAPEDNVRRAVQVMVEHHIGSILVMDGQTLVGIFTERDLLDRVVAAGADLDKTRIGSVMTRDPLVVHETEDVLEAYRTLLQAGHRHLPVLRNGKPIGVLSTRSPRLADLLTVAEHKLGKDFGEKSLQAVIQTDFEDELTQYARDEYGTKVFRKYQRDGKVDELKNAVRDEFKKVYNETKRCQDAKTRIFIKESTPASGSGKGPLIYVIDDENTMLECFRVNLAARNFRVKCFEKGADALLAMEKEAPDLVILDWVMPRMNGLEVLREIHSIPGMKFVPIVMVSAVQLRSDDASAAAACGVDDYMTKPIDFDLVVNRIHRLLKQPA